jgi:hypothetical protein
VAIARPRLKLSSARIASVPFRPPTKFLAWGGLRKDPLNSDPDLPLIRGDWYDDANVAILIPDAPVPAEVLV